MKHNKTAVPRKPDLCGHPADLRSRAEARLCGQRKGQRPRAGDQRSEADTIRLLHEMEVHQIELEMQNAELQNARDELEVALEKYTDLYDFAPVGYFSLDESGVILDANLTGATLLGVERSRLINRRFLPFVAATSRSIFPAFLKNVFTGPKNQACEALLLKEGGGTFWAGILARFALSLKGTRKWCRVAVEDISARKQAAEAQGRLEAMVDANRVLKQEIARRQTVEQALKESEQQQRALLDQSRHMQEELRQLSRLLLSAQEEERKKISRELHDIIAQTLTGINIRLAALRREAALHPKAIARSIAHTQQLVEHSVNIVHQFARELRPTVLDDLGLIPALHTFMKRFREQTGIRVSLSAFAAVEQVNGDKRTVLYRVAQEALTNVARHAQASRAEVKIQKLDGAVCMKIKDNGKGFQKEYMLQAKKSQRLGLLGMRERVEMVGGQLSIESAPGKGTIIQAQIPLANAARGGGAGRKLAAEMS